MEILKYEDLLKLINTNNDAINWARNNGLLADKFICCEMEMQLKTTNDNKNGIRWKCWKCKSTKSIKKNSVFENSNLPINILIKLMYLWVNELQSNIIAFEQGINSKHTTTKWFKFLRELIAHYQLTNQTKLGGPNKIVEIDEMKLGRRKYHRGRRVEGQWIFGMIERNSNPLKINFFPVADRSRETLGNIILNWVEPETIIISDLWKAYSFLNNHNYYHYTVNHSQNFRDPITGAHTNNIENSWNLLRKSMPKFGTTKKMYSSYIQLHAWKRQNKDKNLFNELLKIIKLIYSFN